MELGRQTNTSISKLLCETNHTWRLSVIFYNGVQEISCVTQIIFGVLC